MFSATAEQATRNDAWHPYCGLTHTLGYWESKEAGQGKVPE